MLEKLERHRAELEQRSADLVAMLNEFSFFENQCRRSLNAMSSETAKAKTG